MLKPKALTGVIDDIPLKIKSTIWPKMGPMGPTKNPGNGCICSVPLIKMGDMLVNISIL